MRIEGKAEGPFDSVSWILNVQRNKLIAHLAHLHGSVSVSNMLLLQQNCIKSTLQAPSALPHRHHCQQSILIEYDKLLWRSWEYDQGLRHFPPTSYFLLAAGIWTVNDSYITRRENKRQCSYHYCQGKHTVCPQLVQCLSWSVGCASVIGFQGYTDPALYDPMKWV